VADSPRFCWYGPHYQLYKLASLTRRPEIQLLAKKVQRSGFTRHHSDWLAMLWYDATVDTHRPAAIPLTKRFHDWDLAIMRSSWRQDATICSFRCSPVGGHQAEHIQRPAYPGSGHCHPDANSFTIFSRGEWLAADAGAALTKQTHHHNTLTFNGVGQRGEGHRWLRGRALFGLAHKPRLVFQDSTPDYEYFAGDASHGYRKEAGLRKFLRHFLYVKPDTVVIVDQVETAQPSSVDWLLHTPGSIHLSDRASAQIEREHSVLHVAWAAPGAISARARTQEIETEYPGMDWEALNVLALHTDSTEQTWIATALIATDPGEQPSVNFRTPSPTTLEITVQRGETGPLEIRLDDIRPSGTASPVPLQISVGAGNDSPPE